MSKNPNSRGEELAVKRLLKANNVQRRRFEKMAETAVAQATRNASQARTEAKEVVYNKVVEETMGHDLQSLLDLRAKIQAHKQAIEHLRKQAYEPVRRRLVKRGISAKAWSDNLYGRGALTNFYLDPPAVDEKSEDVCVKVVGNPMVEGRLMDCPNNEPYQEFLRRCEALDEASQQVQLDGDELLESIWQLVTTDEIVDAIHAFKEKHRAG